MSSRSLIFCGTLAVTASILHAQTDPPWWTPGVIRSGDSHAIADNYRPINLGQLMSLADEARLHLDTQLATMGGAGPIIETMVATWPSNSPDAYRPVNLGQLKNIADKFYTRLDEIHFDYKSQLIANGSVASSWTGNPSRPWNESTPVASNYAIANIGQAKLLFSFTLSGFAPIFIDSDLDGMSDSWETAHGYNPLNGDSNNNGVPDGADDSDGDGLSNAGEEATGTDPAVQDTDDDGIADNIDEAPTIPNPDLPVNLHVSPASDDDPMSNNRSDVHVRWDAGTGVTGYTLEKTSDAAVWTTIATLGGGATEFADNGLLGQEHYLYRLTAYRELNGSRAYSKPAYANYEVGMELEIFVKSAEISRQRWAYQEYTPSGTGRPKFYLTETSHAEFTESYSNTSGPNSSWSSFYGHHNYVSTKHPLSKGEADTGDQDGGNHSGTSGTNTSSHSYTDWNEIYTYTKDGRQKGNTTLSEAGTRKKHTADDVAQTDINGTVASGTGTRSQQDDYDITNSETFVPTSGFAQWFGDDYDISQGTITYAGTSTRKPVGSVTGQAFSPTTVNNTNVTSTESASGAWTPARPWSSGVFTTYRQWGDLATTQPTIKTYAKSITPTAGSDYTFTASGSIKLTVEYTDGQFLADTIANMSDYDQNWPDWGQSFISLPSLGTLAYKTFSEDGMYMDLQQSKYKFTAGPSVPYKLTWLELWVPNDLFEATDPPPPPQDLEVTQTRSLSLGGSSSGTPASGYEVQDALSRNKNGFNYVMVPEIRFSAVSHNGVSDDNLDDNAYMLGSDDWSASKGWKWMPGAGKRIFPDAQFPTDTVAHDEVEINVPVGLPNVNVYLKIIDVDDPTPDKYDLDPATQQRVVDTTDNGGEKGGDNKGTDGGTFVGGGVTLDCVTDSTGIAKVGNALPRMKVSMHPGNNYRVAVAFKKADLGILQVTNKGGQGYVPADSEGVEGFKGGVSEMLTVWRKLNLEVDSMVAPPLIRDAPDRVMKTGASWNAGTPEPGQSTLLFDNTQLLSSSVDFYAFGKVKSNSTALDIVRSSALGVTVGGTYTDATAPTFINHQVEVKDDDDKYLDVLHIQRPLPANQRHAEFVEGIQDQYAQAYIEVVDANEMGWNPRQTIPFVANAPIDSTTGTVLNDAKDLVDNPQFWAFTICCAYQGEEQHDADPDTESVLKGGGSKTLQIWGSESWGFAGIFMEAIREDPQVCRDLNGVGARWLPDPGFRKKHYNDYRNMLFATVAHEIGHAPGNQSENDDHLEGGIMADGGTILGSKLGYFFPRTINRFRNAVKWTGN